MGNVFREVLGADDSAFLEHGALLALVEGDIVEPVTVTPSVGIVEKQAINQFAVHERALDDFLHVGQVDVGVKNSLGQNCHEWTLLAEALAATAAYVNATFRGRFGFQFDGYR